jgi:pimeloyl-ACP methyl ester carboxylesterase
MDLEQLEAHRSRAATPHGSVAFLDVGEGPPTIFVHGVGTNAYLWRHVISGLHGERRCLAIDLPLHGRSDPPATGPLTIGQLAETLHEFWLALGLSAVDLVANDTGGAVAQIFAARHPECLRSLTLTNCETHDNVPPPAFQPTVDLAKLGLLAPSAPALLVDLEAAREAVYGMGYENVEHLPLKVTRSFLEPVLGSPERARQFEEMLAALDPSELLEVEPALRRLTIPTLIVWGTGDEFFERQWAFWLRDTIPGVSDVVEIEGAKLFFPDERANELVTNLRRHWNSVGSTVAS